jgi:hypothetical protein
LNEEYYCKIVEKEIAQLEKLNSFVASITDDNEAAPISGIKKCILTSKPYLLLFRCSPHTISLLSETLLKSHTSFELAIQSTEKFILMIKNHKNIRKLFFEAQIFLGQKKPTSLYRFAILYLYFITNFLQTFNFIEQAILGNGAYHIYKFQVS